MSDLGDIFKIENPWEKLEDLQKWLQDKHDPQDLAKHTKEIRDLYPYTDTLHDYRIFIDKYQVTKKESQLPDVDDITLNYYEVCVSLLRWESFDENALTCGWARYNGYIICGHEPLGHAYKILEKNPGQDAKYCRYVLRQKEIMMMSKRSLIVPRDGFMLPLPHLLLCIDIKNNMPNKLPYTRIYNENSRAL